MSNLDPLLYIDQLPQREEVPAIVPQTERPSESRRTRTDEELDIVEGKTSPAVQVADLRKCPLCHSETKLRGGGIGISTQTRRCTNRACRNEYPIASGCVRVDMPPPPPNPVLLGGPYRGNPDRGASRPPIPVDEPIHRRVAELMRRMTDED